MFSTISEIFAVLKGMLELWNYFKDAQENQRKLAADKKIQDMEKSIEDLKVAKTEQEIWDAQNRVVDSKS